MAARADINPGMVKLCLFLVYLIFAILLNSVGTVILQVINDFGVAKTSAATLEGFKDISIAVASFALASFLPRFGYRNAMVSGLLFVGAACLFMVLTANFLASKILFLIIGVSFALVKVAVFSTIGLITENRREHVSLMNLTEGLFMVGVLSGYWLFSFFIPEAPTGTSQWLDVYWVLAALCALSALLIASTPFPEPERAESEAAVALQDFVDMLRLFARPLVYIFVISIFLYVLIEQGIGTWLPTFNNEVLNLSSAMSVQAASIYAATLAIGRIGAGVVMRNFSWYPVLNLCVFAMALLVIFTLPLAGNISDEQTTSWLQAPVAALVFPLIGIFMAPIYPALNSVILSALPTSQHAAMTGLIVVFSALGGTTGSLITGFVFGAFDGSTAFYLTLVPMAMILAVMALFRRAVDRHNDGPVSADAPAE